MVNPKERRRLSNSRNGSLLIELLAAVAILLTAVVPIAYAFGQEQKICRAYYNRAVATEIVDGEMETLVAGEWRSCPGGVHPYMVRAESAKNLPPGKFEVDLQGKTLRLAWIPEDQGKGGSVIREATLP